MVSTYGELLESLAKRIAVNELTLGSTNTYEDKVLSIREYVLVEICLAVPASPSVYLFK